MAHGSAADVATKWSQRSQAAAPDYTTGIQRVTTAPGQLAAAASATWLARLNDPATVAKFQRKVAAVSLQAWQNAATQYGASRYSQGVAAKEGKFASAMQNLLPFIDNAVAQVKAMPNATFEDRLQRSRAMQTIMHSYTGGS